MLRLLWSYYRPHLPALVLAVLCMALVSLAIGAQVFLVRHVLDGLLIRGDRDLLGVLPAAVVLCYGLQAAGEFGRGYLMRRTSLIVVLELRNRLFEHYQKLSLDFFPHRSIGRMISRVTHDAEAVQRATTVIITLLQKPLTFGVLLVAAAWQEPELTLAALVGVPLVLVPVARLDRRLRRYTVGAMDAMARLTSLLQQSLVRARVIRAFGMESFEVNRFRAQSKRQFELSLRAATATLLSGPLVQVVAAFGAAALIWVGGERVLAGRSSPGSLLAFLLSLGLMYDPLKSLAKVPLLLTQARVGLERVHRVLDARPTVLEQPGARILEATHCAVEFDHVWFGYDNSPVLQDVSFRVEPGTRVAIVGPSGAGKSTLLDLILRFHDVDRGAVRINGIDVRDLTLDSLRKHVGLVTQDPLLSEGSIRENITCGVEGRSQTDLVRAAERARAAGFIASLPEGYDTRVGNLGSRLSGGERQRIAIARALFKDAPILLLDEATASLDQESEDEVQAALEHLMQERTTLQVAHRLSAARSAARILVLVDGRIVQEGSHEQLVQKGGWYASMYARQTAGGDHEPGT